jgi:hypothetical protein
VSRDSTYDLLTSIWRLSHPDSRSPDDQSEYDTGSLSSRSYSDDPSSIAGEEDSLPSKISSVEGSEDGDHSGDKPSAPDKEGGENEPSRSAKDTGPENHDKTECDCGKEGHYDKVVCDEIVKASLGKVWTCVFGESKEFMMSFLRDNQKVQGIAIEPNSTDFRHKYGRLETGRGDKKGAASLIHQTAK